MFPFGPPGVRVRAEKRLNGLVLVVIPPVLMLVRLCFGMPPVSSPTPSSTGSEMTCNASWKTVVFSPPGTGGCYLNESLIHEIRHNTSAIFQNLVSICCRIEFVQLW
jgi:hypothetical protein